MTRQEPQARRRLCKRPLRSSAKKPVLWGPPLSQLASSKKASPSSSKAGSASQRASSRRSASQARGGEQITKCFRKTRKMTSLTTPPRRKPSVPRAGAHRNGLRDVGEARTRPLQPPESRRLATPICYILRNLLVLFAESFGLAESFGVAVP